MLACPDFPSGEKFAHGLRDSGGPLKFYRIIMGRYMAVNCLFLGEGPIAFIRFSKRMSRICLENASQKNVKDTS